MNNFRISVNCWLFNYWHKLLKKFSEVFFALLVVIIVSCGGNEDSFNKYELIETKCFDTIFYNKLKSDTLFLKCCNYWDFYKVFKGGKSNTLDLENGIKLLKSLRMKYEKKSMFKYVSCSNKQEYEQSQVQNSNLKTESLLDDNWRLATSLTRNVFRNFDVSCDPIPCDLELFIGWRRYYVLLRMFQCENDYKPNDYYVRVLDEVGVWPDCRKLYLMEMPDAVTCAIEDGFWQKANFPHYNGKDRDSDIGGTGGTGGTGGNPRSEIIETNAFLENERLSCIWGDFSGRDITYKYVKKFDGEFPVAHLVMNVDYDMSSNINAVTSPPENYVMKITINGNNIQDRTNTEVARTIIHELIHAEMFRKLLSIAKTSETLKKSDLEKILSNGDFPGMLDYYTRYGTNFQHEQMAGFYIKTISSALMEYDSTLDIATANALAWKGLMGTDEWYDKPSTEKGKIIDLQEKHNINGNKICE